MMVLQGNAQVIADIIQFGGINVPGLPGQLHRASKGNLGGLNPAVSQHLCNTDRSNEALWAARKSTPSSNGVRLGHSSAKVGWWATSSQVMPWR